MILTEISGSKCGLQVQSIFQKKIKFFSKILKNVAYIGDLKRRQGVRDRSSVV